MLSYLLLTLVLGVLQLYLFVYSMCTISTVGLRGAALQRSPSKPCKIQSTCGDLRPPIQYTGLHFPFPFPPTIFPKASTAVKKRLHGIYKFQRAQNLTDLVRDLVKHALNHSMAYVADANEYNDAFIARARRELRKLGLRDGELRYELMIHELHIESAAFIL